MIFNGDIKDLQEGIDIIAYDEIGESVSVKKINDMMVVIGDENGYFIEYGDKSDFFRGLSLLTHKIRCGEKNFRIEQKRNFKTCGMMIDVSRNAVLTVESVKRYIVYMAKMGLNMLMLYTEDTYKMEKYPYFGYMRGAYTRQEIKEIVEYAEIFGIEVIPCIQTLAHQRKAIQWDYAKDFTDTDDILLVDEPKTYEYIEEMIKTSREYYKSDRIHIGMDEAFNIGLGNYLRRNGYKERLDICLDHIKKVILIVEKYGFKPMIWSDMLFRDNRVEEVRANLPKEMELVYWQYWKDDQKEYDDGIKMHHGIGINPVFAGGLHTWNSFSVKYDKVFATQKPALSACIENGVEEVFATVWGDDGGECNIFATLLGMQLYAEYNYCGDDSNIEEDFRASTGYDMEAFMLTSLDLFDSSICPKHDANNAKAIFYQDVLEGLFDRNLRDYDFKQYYKEYIEKLERLEPQGDLQYLFDFYKKFVKVLYDKCDIGIELYDAYQNEDKARLNRLADRVDTLYADYQTVHEAMAEVWYKDNKPFGFEIIDCRMGGVETRIKRAKQRVMQFIEGTINSIPELEEERLYFSGQETPFTSGGIRGTCWDGVFAAGPIKGA